MIRLIAVSPSPVNTRPAGRSSQCWFSPRQPASDCLIYGYCGYCQTGYRLEYRLDGVIPDVVLVLQPHFSCSYLPLICLSTNQNIQLIHSLLIRIEWTTGNGILVSSSHWPIYNKLYPDKIVKKWFVFKTPVDAICGSAHPLDFWLSNGQNWHRTPHSLWQSPFVTAGKI